MMSPRTTVITFFVALVFLGLYKFPMFTLICIGLISGSIAMIGLWGIYYCNCFDFWNHTQ